VARRYSVQGREMIMRIDVLKRLQGHNPAASIPRHRFRDDWLYPTLLTSVLRAAHEKKPGMFGNEDRLDDTQ